MTTTTQRSCNQIDDATEMWTIGLADPSAASFTGPRSTSLPLYDASTTGSTVRRQHKQDIVDPPSVIKLFQEHPSDIPPVGTVELICMQEAVTFLIWPRMHVVALAQNDPGGHGQACRAQHGFHRRPLQQQGKVAGLHVL